MKQQKTIPKSIQSFDTTSIYYEIDPPTPGKKYLIFLHGLTGDLSAWNAEREELRRLGYATLALDLRGHGLSAHPDRQNAYELDNFAGDVITIIRKERIEKVTLIGHCFGGMITLLLAGKYVIPLSSLVLVDTSYKAPYFSTVFPHHLLLMKLLKLLTAYVPSGAFPGHTNYKKFIGTGDFDLRRIAHDMMHTSLRSYFMVCEKLTHFDASNLLEDIHIPTLILEGTNDTIFPPHLVQALHHRLKRSLYELVPNANHVLVINNPKDLVKDMHTFLKRIKF